MSLRVWGSINRAYCPFTHTLLNGYMECYITILYKNTLLTHMLKNIILSSIHFISTFQL